MAEPQVKEVEAKANRVTGRDSEAIADQIDVLRKDLSAITDLLAEIGVRRKDETLAAARARMESLRAQGETRLTEARVQALDAQEQAFEAIRRQPGMAVGIAAAIGFFAGLLTSRR
jgi:ElaB/YqjD/DUF883 family membrane-anchored ribosome-binding protein